MNNKKRSIALWAVALSVLSLSALLIFTAVFHQIPGDTGGRLVVPVDAQDHKSGNSDAAVTVVVYSDFQCPSCGDFNKVLQRLEGEYSDSVLFVHRHLPLQQHAFSPLAAFAAEAAAHQNKFAAMRDLLFERAAKWSASSTPADDFEAMAKELGLDIERFRRDMNSSEVMTAVVDDLEGAVRSGARGTPAVFLNGRLLPDSYPEANLRKDIDEAKNR